MNKLSSNHYQINFQSFYVNEQKPIYPQYHSIMNERQDPYKLFLYSIKSTNNFHIGIFLIIIINVNKSFLIFFCAKRKKIDSNQTNKQTKIFLGSTNTEKINKMQRANGRRKRKKKVHIWINAHMNGALHPIYKIEIERKTRTHTHT